MAQIEDSDFIHEYFEFLSKHPEYRDKSVTEIAKAMVIELIQNTPMAEDVYPGIKEQLIKAVEESDPEHNQNS